LVLGFIILSAATFTDKGKRHRYSTLAQLLYSVWHPTCCPTTNSKPWHRTSSETQQTRWWNPVPIVTAKINICIVCCSDFVMCSYHYPVSVLIYISINKILKRKSFKLFIYTIISL
jgi:hypothetical protein